MKTRQIILFILFLFPFNFCDSTDPKPPDNKPPGYQEDIPWPSLANSPWPIHHSDAQSTGRSQYTGPSAGVVEWTYPLLNDFRSGIVLSEDQQIIFSTNHDLMSLTTEGNKNWDIRVYGFKINSTPLITNSNDIIFFDGYTKILSINMNRDTNWAYEFELSDMNVKSLCTDKEGNIFFTTSGGNSGTFYSLSMNGELNWKIEDSKFYKLYNANQMSFSPNGRYIYFPAQNVSILAIDITERTIAWEYGNEFSSNSIVDSYGNIYFQTTTGLFSIDEKGTENWRYIHGHSDYYSLTTSPCIDRDGNLYFGTDTLYSLNYKGELRWKQYLKGICDAPIVCDNENNVYVGARLNGITFSKYDQDGTLMWQVAIQQTYLNGSPAITKAGRLIYPTLHNQVVSIK
jgi:hypothetical protein